MDIRAPLTIGVFFDLSRFAAQIRLTLRSALIKTVFIPLVFTPAAYLFGIRGTYLVAVYVLFGVPTVISGYIMAKDMGADDEIARSIIILSTAISLLKSLSLISRGMISCAFPTIPILATLNIGASGFLFIAMIVSESAKTHHSKVLFGLHQVI